jgi:alkylation response protein AidB-like acyl-CoA dehydrogenase
MCTERFGICIQAARLARICVEESFTFAARRKTFGKPLLEQPVIRAKLADMVRQVEATQAWLELVALQMKEMSHKEAMVKLGGATALLKVQCTKTLEYCAREAVQIMGGTGYTRSSGLGSRIERIYRMFSTCFCLFINAAVYMSMPVFVFANSLG